jgi:hypothetical protein
MKLGIYIIAPEPISIPSISLFVCICIPLIVARQRLGNHVLAATNTRKNIKIIRRVIFYAVHVLSKESLWVYVSPSIDNK